jgi:WD40 repeat protein
MSLAPLLVLLLGVPQDPAEELSPSPNPRFKHSVRFSDAAVSPDGTILIGVDLEGSIRGWDVRTARSLYGGPVAAKAEGPKRLTCSPDGRFVAVSSQDFDPTAVIVLRLATGKEARRLDRCFSPVFSPDGEILAAADGDKVRRWSMKSGAELPALEAEGQEFKWAAWSRKGDLLAASDAYTGDVVVWNVATRRSTTYADTEQLDWPATGLAFSPDGKRLAVGNHWGIRFLNLTAEPARPCVAHEEYASGPLRFSPDGRRMIALSRRRRMLLWDHATGRHLFTWTAYQAADALQVAEACNAVIWFDRGGLRVERIPELLAGKEAGHVVQHASFASDGRVITVGDDGGIRLWDPATQTEVSRHAAAVAPLTFHSCDGKRVVYGSGSEPILIWDLEARKEIVKVTPTLYVGALALSPDEKTIGLGHADGLLSLWDVAGSKERTRIKLEMAGVCAIAWSSDGKTLACGDKLGAVAIVDGATGLHPTLFQPRDTSGIQELRFDGKSLLVWNDKGTCWTYKDELGQEPVRVQPERIRYNWDEAPGRQWVATGFGQRRRGVSGHYAEYSPDGRYAVTTADAGRMLIWEAPGEK